MQKGSLVAFACISGNDLLIIRVPRKYWHGFKVISEEKPGIGPHPIDKGTYNKLLS